MNRFKEDEIVPGNRDAAESTGDGVDRRNFLGCMAWAGTGLLWSMVGGLPTSKLLAAAVGGIAAKTQAVEDFSFVQISDCHIGFNKGANPDVTGTLKKAIDRANLVPAGMKAPDFMLHRRYHAELKGSGVRYGLGGDQGLQERGVLCSG